MNTPFDRALFDQVMVPNYRPQPIIPVRGQGSRLWDQQGREYIDFAGGIATNVLGHCHPDLVDTLKLQADQLWHLSNVYTNQPALALAQQLVEATFADRVFFANSGAEANEAAFKLARRYGYDHFGEHKHEIIAFEQSFHGRTLFTVSVGGQAKYKQGFEPTPKGITHLPFNDIDALKAAVNERTCAVVMEPIQGEGGVIPATAEFARAARELCDQHQALLVFDEVQTGIGRTGSLFAYQQLGVNPDIMTSAKALGGGFPIGAMLATEQVAASLIFGTHGSTFGGNPLACAVAGKVIEIVNQASLLSAVSDKQQRFTEGLAKIQADTGLIKQVRGQGLLLGAELIEAWHGRAGEVLAAARELGLLLLMAGPNVLRFTPSLIIEDDLIERGLDRLAKALQQLKDDG